MQVVHQTNGQTKVLNGAGWTKLKWTLQNM